MPAVLLRLPPGTSALRLTAFEGLSPGPQTTGEPDRPGKDHPRASTVPLKTAPGNLLSR
jgi:hypothetical protein